MNDDQMRELFGEMRDEAIPVESLTRVRLAVAGRVQARRRMVRMGWKIGVPLVVAGCLTAVMLRVRTIEPSPVASSPAAVVEAEQSKAEQSNAEQNSIRQGAPVEPLPPKPALRRPVRPASVAKPVLNIQAAPIEGGANEIRIESPLEPDVVIVLIGG